MKSFSCETERLLLRPLAEGDEAFFHAIYTDPEIMRFIGTPLTETQAAGRFRKIVRRQLEATAEGKYLVILVRETHKAIGICGTSDYDAKTGALEVGLVLTHEGRKQGFAREALAALVENVFLASRIQELCVRFSPENVAAQKLASSVGFLPCTSVPSDGRDSSRCYWSAQRQPQCPTRSFQ
ncbi:GNAT family N-acetyltransferase [Rhodanobacter ginsengisoli]|uniref:GNAT family N-acetyltransferase n=1 Tax=Rhodanobacter ginsengisoli TaxID=418646 RepID=A0ABW0QKZ5_9GAMM